MSIVKIAKKTGVSQKAIQNFIYDKNKNGASVDVLKKLSSDRDLVILNNVIERTKSNIIKNIQLKNE